MKKGLLLSVVASGILFAGGNIAPVAPVAPAAPAAVAPAACDFWGSIGFRYDANDFEIKYDGKTYDEVTIAGKKLKTLDFGDAENNKATLALVMGVEKELGYGFGFGAELAGAITADGKFKHRKENAEISQLYLTYKNGNTAVKLGRQALPKSLSPWAWSDRTAGILDRAYNGLVVVNTDVANTTLVGAWIHSYNDANNNMKIADDKGIFMLAGQYTGIANTTLTGSVYYKPKGEFEAAGKELGTGLSAWVSAETKVNNVDLGLQAVYARIKPSKKTFAVAAYAGTSFDAIDAKLTLAYINKGETSLVLGSTSGFWGNALGGVFGGNILPGTKQRIVKLDLGYKVANGRIYAGAAYDKLDKGAKLYGGRIGYDFKVADVNAKVEYRYAKGKYGKGELIGQRIRVQGVYKF